MMSSDDELAAQNEGLARVREREEWLARIREVFKAETENVKKEVLAKLNESDHVADGLEDIQFDWSNAEENGSAGIVLPFLAQFETASPKRQATRDVTLSSTTGTVEIEVQRDEFEVLNLLTWTMTLNRT